MFWDIVGAILFVFVGIPIIIYVALALLAGVFSVLESKEGRNGCGIIIGVILLLGVFLYISQRNAYEQSNRNYETQLNNERTFKQSLRNANRGQEGYFIMYSPTGGLLSVVENTDGTFTLYDSASDCYSSLYKYTERYDYDSWDYSCELL